MAHFAQLDENNIVIRVEVVNNWRMIDDTTNGEESEEVGLRYLRNQYGPDIKWVQTSYNNNFRFRYACIGHFYDETNDVFYNQQPFPSWTLNTTTWEWEPPIQPTEEQIAEDDASVDKDIIWNEDVYQADTGEPKTQGWVLTEYS